MSDITTKENNNETKREFLIFKVKKNYFDVALLGKKKKGRKPKKETKRRIHTNYSYDNILRKIKMKFLYKIIKYIN